MGRELITDRITALFELVKNCYDANATKVTIEFIEVNPITTNSKIIITDNGIGMSIDDIKNKWMVIGTSSKRSNRLSPEPFKRKVVGQKGIGRFAVDKLGSKLLMKTKEEISSEITYVELNWNEYEKASLLNNKTESGQSQQLFTQIENKFWVKKAKNEISHGTILEISDVRDTWTKMDIERVIKQLSKLVSPFFQQEYPFQIKIKSDSFGEVEVKNNAILHATEEIHLSFDIEKKLQDSIIHEKGDLKVIQIPERNCGLLKFDLYYFDQQAKIKFRRETNNEEKIDGIKIYRDGLITTPFAEYEDQNIYKRDVLGIDKRRYSGFFDKVSSSDLFGFVEITDQGNQDIKDSTNRQDFEDNDAYRELKRFITEQLEELEDYLKFHREKVREKSKTGLNTVKGDIKDLVNLVKQIQETAPPEIKKQLIQLEKTGQLVQVQINKGIKAFDDLEKEKIRQENLFMSLMSLQDYAFEITHVINTFVSFISGDAEFIKWVFPHFSSSNLSYQEEFEISANRIHDKVQNLKKILEFLLSYAQSNVSFTKIDVKQMITDLFEDDVYSEIFKNKGIKVEVNFEQTLIVNHNEQFFRDIFQNLITNSVKAIEDNETEKLIKCTGRVEKDKFIIHFSDNGYGISEEDKNRIFNIFFTKTEEKGGAGIGLYIVRKRVESMKGVVRVIENEFKPSGATIEIILPFAN